MTIRGDGAWYESATAIFRRQYIASPGELEGFGDWRCARLGPLHIYAHPDLELTVRITEGAEVTKRVVLLGFALDPLAPAATNEDIVAGLLATALSASAMTDYLHRLSGRFALFVISGDDVFVANDACGLRPVFYVKTERGLHFSSNPQLLRETLGLPFTDAYRAYVDSQFFRFDKEHWLPSDTELIRGVRQLVPNHLLRVRDGEQIRFWPVAGIASRGPADAVERASRILSGGVDALALRGDISLALSAGFD